jgi:hypothetical protein
MIMTALSTKFETGSISPAAARASIFSIAASAISSEVLSVLNYPNLAIKGAPLEQPAPLNVPDMTVNIWQEN